MREGHDEVPSPASAAPELTVDIFQRISLPCVYQPTRSKHMAMRVLSSDQGRASITRLQAILNNGIAEQIRALRSEGEVLSDPNVWDGQLAEDFRSNTWPGAAQSLQAAVESLEALRGRVHGINNDIMAAGGNG